MANQNQIKNFKQCISFFNVPDLEEDQLSDSERELYTLCFKFFSLGKIDFDDINFDVLDSENKRKVSEFISQVLDSF
ncbi:hypothetical protein [Sulfuracidifex metallicus]|uniref:hypothetical protein n=1 Tax=Sulfuracidifex metallicus TaxID=47303 RepID=UPI002273DD94|nr:hypothetical protein [Sulfuracidifex metallicus]MCY0851093.1 hypothetical protein [Sulfuracidifex metallicus]